METTLRRASLALLCALAAAPSAAQLSLPPDYAWRQLSPPGEAGSSVRFGFRVDPRGEWVVFVGDVELDGLDAVYAVRRHGTRLHRLSAYAAPGAIQQLSIAPGGRRVLFRGDLETTGRDELWSAPLPGTPASAVKLNGNLTGDGVLMYAAPASGSRLVYLAQNASGTGLWSVPLAGPASESVPLHPPLAENELPIGAAISPNGSHAVLVLFDPVGETSRLWSVPVAGPASEGTFVAESTQLGCNIFGGAFPPSTPRFAYAVSCDTPVGSRFNQLWSVPYAGPASEAESLAGSFVEGGAIELLEHSPDGQYLVFRADKSIDEKFDLWRVPIAGTVADLERLNPTLPSGGDVRHFEISPDSSRVAYVADQVTNEVFRAWSVPIEGPPTSAEPLVSGIVAFGADVDDLKFSPDSQTIVLRGDLTQIDRLDLYAVPADGSATQNRITNESSIPGPEHSVSYTWRFHPDGERLVFVFDEDAPNDRRGLGEQRLSPEYAQDARLNDDPVAGGIVSDFEIFPDSMGTLYYSDELVDGEFHLFTVDVRIFGDGFEEGTTAAWGDLP